MLKLVVDNLFISFKENRINFYFEKLFVLSSGTGSSTTTSSSSQVVPLLTSAVVVEYRKIHFF